MKNNYHKILMVYIEPTPYIVGLINALNTLLPNQIDILFLNENVSQKWEIPRNPDWLILPNNIKQKIIFEPPKISRFQTQFRNFFFGQIL